MNTFKDAVLENGIEKYASYEAIITGVNCFGCHIKFYNTNIHGFFFGNGNIGDSVIVSVGKIDEKKQRITCFLDSVLEYGCDNINLSAFA